MSYQPAVDILADHSIILAIPAFVPAFALVGIVVFLAVRDRRAERREADVAGTDESDAPDHTDTKESR